jgi:MauM/NapG family ferredoxin protein
MAADLFSGILAGMLILLSVTSGDIWCSRLCPLGGMQDLLSRIRSIFRRGGENAPSAQSIQARRTFIVLAAGAGLGVWARRGWTAQNKNMPLRPPGAIDEKEFSGICVRCGNCVRSCPSKIIHPDVGVAGITSLIAPVIRYRKQYCLEDCIQCIQACPTGALQSLDLKQKRAYVIGEAVLDESLCLLALEVKDCDACARSCPFDAIQIHWDEDRYIAYPIVDSKKCNGCGACEVVCPAGDKAIRITKLQDYFEIGLTHKSPLYKK